LLACSRNTRHHLLDPSLVGEASSSSNQASPSPLFLLPTRQPLLSSHVSRPRFQLGYTCSTPGHSPAGASEVIERKEQPAGESLEEELSVQHRAPESRLKQNRIRVVLMLSSKRLYQHFSDLGGPERPPKSGAQLRLAIVLSPARFFLSFYTLPLSRSRLTASSTCSRPPSLPRSQPKHSPSEMSPAPSTSKLVLITGVSGFVGSATTLEFLQKGWRGE
jgi:hypothetical protein